jgi:PKD repeat protein
LPYCFISYLGYACPSVPFQTLHYLINFPVLRLQIDLCDKIDIMKKKSTLFRIDEQVFFTMVGLCVLSLVILGFRFALADNCYPIKIQLPADTVLAGNRVNFKAETKGGKKFIWDFRDGTVKEEENSMVSHIFKTPGKYTISVTVNKKCSEYFTLVVVKVSTKLIRQSLPTFSGPATVNVNEPVSFEDTSSFATSWEWQFEEGGEVESRNKKATHTYTAAGRRIITLTVNGRPDMTVWRYIDVVDTTEKEPTVVRTRPNGSRRDRITEVPTGPSVAPIIPVPTPPEPEPEPEPIKKAPMITGAELEKMFLEVTDGRKSASDFTEYLCGQLNANVSYNNNRITFTQMCVDMEKVKKRRVKKITVTVFRNETTNCIESLVVTLKKTII